MLKISKSNKIQSIERRYQIDDFNTSVNIDSFIIIPGVTTYISIFSIKNVLSFIELGGNSINVTFSSESELERFFVQLMRDIKLNKIINEEKESK